jgi:plasmid stabilization system protein ParE
VRYRLRVAPQAEAQIREAARWWWENRPKAPEAFSEDLEEAFGLISLLPKAGQPVRHTRINELRRVLLGRVRYYLYYQVNDASEAVEVLALWHASRSGSPSLG